MEIFASHLFEGYSWKKQFAARFFSPPFLNCLNVQEGKVISAEVFALIIQTTITALFLGQFWKLLHQNKWLVKHFTPKYTYIAFPFKFVEMM